MTRRTVSARDQARVVQLLLLDVEATLGSGHDAVVQQYAEKAASLVDTPDCFRDKVVEDVQQYFHDCFVDTTWPACPNHVTHPLWLRGESWYCERDDHAIAKLGELRRRQVDEP